MILNSSKILFISMLILSTLITISSTNWFGMWMGLEMNLMSFIPLIYKSKNKSPSKAMMIYFLAQSIGSITLLFSILFNSMMFMSTSMVMEINKMLILVGVFIKLGASPFHFWLPEMMANLNWNECLIMMTWQKVAPLFMLFNLNSTSNWFYYTVVMFSSITGAVGGINQTSLRKMFAYSSINHMSWMMMMISACSNWYKYLIIYSILMIMICMFLKKKNALFINQLNSMSFSMTEKLTYTIMMLSIGGLPPFLGFLPKWMVIQMMIDSEMYFLLMIMMFMSLLTLFYYMRMMTPFILNYTTMNKWSPTNKISMMMFMINFINLTLPLFLINSFF